MQILASDLMQSSQYINAYLMLKNSVYNSVIQDFRYTKKTFALT